MPPKPGGPASARKTAGVKAATSARKAAPTPDDAAEYVMNLKGQVYLLTIENEMLKRTGGAGGATARAPAGANAALGASRAFAPAPSSAAPPAAPSASAFSGSLRGGGGGGGGGGGATSPPAGAFTVAPVASTASLLRDELPPASYPSEIGDSFELMRAKYAALEARYATDLDEARRGAEALASQVAAQSSLITTLKKEMAAGLDTVRAQKHAMQEVEARGRADLERAERDIATLHDRLAEAAAAIAAKGDELARAATTMADLRSVAANASAEKNAAESTRQRTLESYGRVYVVTRYLLQRWRVERRDKLAIMESFEKMRADKVRALEVRDKAVSDMETAVVGAAEAYGARDRALAAHRETAATMNVVEQEVLRLTGELEVKAALLAELDRAAPELQKKADAAGATAAKAVAQKEAAIRRANELERLLADKAGEADELRAAAVAAEGRMTAAIARVKGLEDDAAAARARAAAVEHSDAALEAQVARLTAELSAAGQRAAATDAETAQLKDELAKRPPIDIIRQLDVGNLMQRNMQAAAAMHSLLAWRDAHEAHPGPQLPAPE